MAKYPSFNLWTDAYLADTHPALTLEEHGAYLLLLMFMWRAPRQRIPNDDEWIARNLSIPVEDVKKTVRPLIKKLCILDGNFISQKRLKIEWKKAQKRHKNASVAAKARHGKNKIPAQAHAETVRKPYVNRKQNNDMSSATITTAITIDKNIERAEGQAAPGGAHSLDSENEKGNGAATLLPSDWTASEALRNHAVEAGFSKSEISAEETNFKDWYGAAEHGKRRDWDAAFRIWIRRGAERRAAKGGKPGAKSQRERWAAITGIE